MKLFLFSLLMAPLFYNITICAEPDNYVCATTGSTLSSSQTGGLYITSQGTLKVLVLFVRFKDDTEDHWWWPSGGNPIDWNTYIDPNIQTGSTHLLNLTNYYNWMSLGTFNVIGQAVCVETPQNKSYYGSNYYLATKEVLQQKVDPLINFNDYDNWRYDSNYHHSNQPDGTVDMIIMIWRGHHWVDQNGWYGIADLGDGVNYTVEDGTKTIGTGFYGSPGSGVTSNASGNRDQKYTFHASIHEVAHWLLGSGHPYSSFIHNIWGMLTSSFSGLCANTYEREKLAWIYPTPITEDIINAPLSDYVTTGTAYKYHPSNGVTNEYYYFENHQKLNIYDDATVNSNDKGIFVVHQGGGYQSGDYIRVKTSNGQWNWQNQSTSNCFDASLPNFIMTSINRTGNNNRDKLTDIYSNSDWLFSLNGVCGGYAYGENVNNSFNLSYNDVFSPYSNPYTHTWSNVQNNFTMEITGINGSTINAKFYLANPTAGKPSKPQDIVFTTNNQVTVNWEKNNEPDRQYWEVWRKYYRNKWDQQDWTLINTRTTNSYTDQDFQLSNNGNNQYSLWYKIRTKDTQGLYSIFSEVISINGFIVYWKTGQTTNADIPKEYFMKQNYPNPFNPTTTFTYALPEPSNVSITVFDRLGGEVAALVNGNQSPGTYFATFDASKLASGVYFYNISAGRFSSTKKMLLIK